MKIFQRISTIITMVSAMSFTAIPNSPAKTAIENIPEYPGSQRLCQEHVSGSAMHILWKSFSTRDAVPAVVTFFEQKLGVKATVGEHDSLKIAHPTDADLVVTIFSKQRAEFFPSCAQKPERSGETIIFISQAIRGQKN